MITQKSILIIGKSPSALETMGSLLRDKGYSVETTNNFEDISNRFKLNDFDLITMGGQVPPDIKSEITRAATELKSNMLFVQGMAAIPGLVVGQIEGELNANLRNPKQMPIFHSDTLTISLSLTKKSQVVVTVWWQTTFVPPNPGSDSRVLCNKVLPAGKHIIEIPADIPKDSSFLTVQIDQATYSIKLT